MLQYEYSKERIALYALQTAAEDPDAKCSGRMISQDWSAQFWEYAKNIRDEDAMRQWGKLLAEEVRQPGSISLKTLSTLRTLDSKNAKNFFNILKYVIDEKYIPAPNITNMELKNLGLDRYTLAILESYGLLIINKNTFLKKGSNIKNRNYSVKINKDIKIECHVLTDVGESLYQISTTTEEDSLSGIKYFSDYLSKTYSLTPKIIKLSI